MFWARRLADAVMMFHFAYVAFVALGLVAILVGLATGKAWARNPWFRVGHLAAILVVVVEAFARIPCPLTVWEANLRRLGGQDSAGGEFIAGCVHRFLFFDLPPWAFTVAYTAFGTLVLATFFLAPPNWRRRPSPHG